MSFGEARQGKATGIGRGMFRLPGLLSPLGSAQARPDPASSPMVGSGLRFFPTQARPSPAQAPGFQARPDPENTKRLTFLAASLSLVPHLTHFVFTYAVLCADLGVAFQPCLAMYTSISKPRCMSEDDAESVQPLAEDARFVVILQSSFEENCARGASGGRNYWALADAFLARGERAKSITRHRYVCKVLGTGMRILAADGWFHQEKKSWNTNTNSPPRRFSVDPHKFTLLGTLILPSQSKIYHKVLCVAFKTAQAKIFGTIESLMCR
ncbi:hypothetical protein B0H11DRAFT_2192332 [Mycena galericulata]|nr:hypothetical protein B0H11DRAFT_2192332 [Mycena galericulata]